VRTDGSVGSSTVTFSGAGELELDDSLQFGGLVAGFGAAPEVQQDLALTGSF